jgi:hypothetical protein
MTRQTITLHLDGITAADYLTWFRDPEPAALGAGLRSVAIDAEPLGTTVAATLDWDRPAPAPYLAAALAGLPVADGVAAVTGSARVQALPERLAA